MADINIQRKKKPVWPWLLALIVVVGIIWVLAEFFDETEKRTEEGNTFNEDSVSMEATTSGAVGATGNAFARYVNNHQPSSEDSIQASYIMEGMDHLSATLGSVVDKKFINDLEVNEKRSELTSKIDQLKADTTAQTLPENVKEAFTSAANLMATLQEKSYPKLDKKVSDLKEIAASIEPASDNSALKSKVEEFFEKSSDVTLVMTDSTNNSF